MKRYILSLFISIAGFFSAFGMSFSEAQEHAYYLTDKMAYELDLTPGQYDQVYQVNLEYLLNVRTSNPFNYYWDYRNTDLSYILFDWQYSLYRACDYFYRPIIRRHHAWYFPLWERYHRTYYYYSRPTIYSSWHGGLWHNRTHHTPSPFYGHRPPTHIGGMAGHGGHPHGSHPAHPGPSYNGGNHNHNGTARPGGNGGNHHNNNGTARPGGNGGNHHNHNGTARPGGNGGNHNHNGTARPGGNGGNHNHHNNNGTARPGSNSGNHNHGGVNPGNNGGTRPGGSGNHGSNGGSRGGYSNSSSRGSNPGGSRGGSNPGGSGSRSFGGGNHR